MCFATVFFVVMAVIVPSTAWVSDLRRNRPVAGHEVQPMTKLTVQGVADAFTNTARNLLVAVAANIVADSPLWVVKRPD